MSHTADYGTCGSGSRTGDCGTGGSASRTGDCGSNGSNGRRIVNFELGTSCKLAPAWGTLPNNMLLFLYLFSLNQPLSELAKLKLIITTLLNFNTLCQSLRDFDKVFLFSRIEIC